MLLKLNSYGEDVKKIQAKLGISVDGDFGKKTEEAVKAWQKENNLFVDGIVGNKTMQLMFPEVKNEEEEFDKNGNEIIKATPLEDESLKNTTSDTDNATAVKSTEASQPAEKPVEESPVKSALKLDQLKGHIPDVVIAQIPECEKTFKINTRLRLAHFLAQCAHESGNFRLTEENLNYSESGLKRVFRKYFKGNLAASYARKPEKIASRVYGGRMGNGNEATKEGYKYRGRGYIQLTGKFNYRAFNKSVEDDVVANPDLVASKYPLLSGAWYWNSRSLNRTADGGSSTAKIKAVTRKVNGGTNGLKDRIKHFKKYYALLA